jgi:hypothetical protein
VVSAAQQDLADGDYVLVARDPPLWPVSADVKLLDAIRSRFALCQDGGLAYPRIDVLRLSRAKCSDHASRDSGRISDPVIEPILVRVQGTINP